MTNEENITPQKSDSKSDSSQQHDAKNNTQSASSTVEAVKSAAADVLDKAKDSAGHVYGIAADSAASAINEQKTHLSGGLSGVADSIRQIGQDLRENDEKNPFVDLTAKYGDAAAAQVERLSGYFDEKDLQDIYRDVESFARRQPAVFIGAAFVVGFLAARFLKSGSGSASKFGSAARSSGSYRSSESDGSNNSERAVVNPS